MTSERHVQMIDRRLRYLLTKQTRGPMEQAEIDALQWALPLLRRTAPAARPSMADACSSCKTPAGYRCVHLT